MDPGRRVGHLIGGIARSAVGSPAPEPEKEKLVEGYLVPVLLLWP